MPPANLDFFGYLWIYTGSIWPASIAHAVHNAAWNVLGVVTLITASPVLVNVYLVGDFGLQMMLGRRRLSIADTHVREATLSLLSNIRFALQRLRGSGGRCGHMDRIHDVTPSSEGCAQCVALGDTWVHLRICMSCGQVGCCDSSKNKHAHRHADEASHPIARSVEPGEDWMWCYVDNVLVEDAR